MTADGPTIEAAKELLASEGYVVLKEKSYRAAQERQRIAQCRAEWAERDMESSRQWARDAYEEQRRLGTRLGLLYGLAQALGATEDQLRGTAS